MTGYLVGADDGQRQEFNFAMPAKPSPQATQVSSQR